MINRISLLAVITASILFNVPAIHAQDEVRIEAITDSNSKIIPGHGPLGDKAQLQAYRDMLEMAYTRLLKLKMMVFR